MKFFLHFYIAILAAVLVTGQDEIRSYRAINPSETTENEPSLTENGASLTENGVSLTENGESLTENGASLTENGVSLTENGTSLTENGTNLTENGMSLTENGDDIPTTSLPVQPGTCLKSAELKIKMKDVKAVMLAGDVFEILGYVHGYRATDFTDDQTEMIEEYNIYLGQLRDISIKWNAQFGTKLYLGLMTKLRRLDSQLIGKFGQLKNKLNVDMKEILKHFKKIGILLDSQQEALLVKKLKMGFDEKSNLISNFLKSIKISSNQLNNLESKAESKYIKEHMMNLKESFDNVEYKIRISIPEENKKIVQLENNINESRKNLKQDIGNQIISTEKSIEEIYKNNVKKIKLSRYETIMKDLMSSSLGRALRRVLKIREEPNRPVNVYKKDTAKLVFLKAIYNDITLVENGLYYNKLSEYRNQMNFTDLFDKVNDITKMLSELELTSEYVNVAEKILGDIHSLAPMFQKISLAVSNIGRTDSVLDEFSNVIQKDLNVMMHRWSPLTENKIEHLIEFIEKFIDCCKFIIRKENTSPATQ